MKSVIICTKNRAQDLRQTLNALAQLPDMSSSDIEVIVVDNGSTDATPDMVRQAEARLPVRYVTEARGGQSAARNAGLHHARGEFIVFTDDDIRPAPAWLAAVTAPLRAGHADIVAGGIQLAPHLVRPWMEARHLGMLAANTHDAPEQIKIAIGANMAFHRRVLDKVPGFDVELGPGAAGFCDDLLFNMQVKEAGYRFTTALGADATVEHHLDAARLTADNFRSRVVREGNSLAYVHHHWSHQDVDNARLLGLKRRLRLLLLQVRNRRRDAVPNWSMMNVLQDIAYYTRMQELKGTPRNYTLRGLVKERGKVLPPLGVEIAESRAVPV